MTTLPIHLDPNFKPLGSNVSHRLWKSTVQAALQMNGLWDVASGVHTEPVEIVGTSEEKPSEEKPRSYSKSEQWEDWNLKNQKALAIITTSISPTTLGSIGLENRKTACGLLAHLEKKLKSTSHAESMRALLEVIRLRKGKNESLEQYLEKMGNCIEKVKTHRPDEDIVPLILDALLENLPEEYALTMDGFLARYDKEGVDM